VRSLSRTADSRRHERARPRSHDPYALFEDVSSTPIFDVVVGLVLVATILGGGLAAIYAVGYFLTGQPSLAWPLVGTLAVLLAANVVVRAVRAAMRRRHG
jgi:hypothetical protein